MTPMRLAQKLGIKEGMRLLVSGQPEGYFDLLAPLPAGAEVVSAAEGDVAFLQLFLRNMQELESLARSSLEGCGKGSLVWIAYPKVSSGLGEGLSRDLVRERLRTLGWRAVTIVAVDATWAALRFRPIEG